MSEALNLLHGDRVLEIGTGSGYQTAILAELVRKGWNEKSPFDAIIVTAAPPTVPQSLMNQVKVGGRMIIPVGETSQRLVIIRRTANGYEQENSLLVAFVPMTGKSKKQKEKPD